MQILTAHTLEIDDVDAAVNAILSQLDLGRTLRRHAVGILSCYCEFVQSGVVKALCDRLPFDVVGCTTLTSSTNGCQDLMPLCILVLTADEVQFSTAFSGPLASADTVGPVLEEAYRRAARALPEPPKLVIPFFPLLRELGGQLLLDELNRLCGGIPIFGTLSCDHTPDFENIATIHNGQSTPHSTALLLLSGDVYPRFYSTIVPAQKIHTHRSLITKSEGYLLKEVNGMPFSEYLGMLGLRSTDELDVIPLIVDYNDGSKPVARAIYLVTPEGDAVCGGNMPEGATLLVGSIDYEDVLEATNTIIEYILAENTGCGALFVACMSRCLALSSNALDEMRQVERGIGKVLPYQMLYSGGELCPVRQKDGHHVNRFHNFTFTACVF